MKNPIEIPPTADYLRVIADMLKSDESAIVSGENEFDLKWSNSAPTEMGLEYWSRTSCRSH